MRAVEGVQEVKGPVGEGVFWLRFAVLPVLENLRDRIKVADRGVTSVVLTMDLGGPSLLADALGSTLALADSLGMVQTQYTFEPFGTTSVSGTPSTNTAQYTGRENDGTGLYYFRARFYSPVLQRFISEDPLLFKGNSCPSLMTPPAASDPIFLTNRTSQGLNAYSFVENNPLIFTDPFGLDKCRKETGCPCDQHKELDWVCVAGLGLAGAPAYIYMGLGSAVAIAKLGPVVGGVVAAGSAAWTVYTIVNSVYKPCLKCVPNSPSPK